MLAAIVPQKDAEQFWTVKFVGDPEPLGNAKEQFLTFLKSWTFKKGNESPDWKIPEGWTISNYDDGFGSVARIYLGMDSSTLFITVSKFRIQGDWNDISLSNVNRWRGQLQLADLNKENFEKETTAVDVADAHAIVMDATGESTGRMPSTGKAPPRKSPAPSDANPTKDENRLRNRMPNPIAANRVIPAALHQKKDSVQSSCRLGSNFKRHGSTCFLRSQKERSASEYHDLRFSQYSDDGRRSGEFQPLAW